MGILPDWLGEGGFVAVTSNPPAGARSIAYARRPAAVTLLSFSDVARYPARPFGAGYLGVTRTAGVNAVSYLVSARFPTAPTTARLLVATSYPPSVSNLSFQ